MSTTMSLFNRRDPFDQLIRQAFSPAWSEPAASDFMPAAETRREGEDALVRLEIPGIDIAEDVTVELLAHRLVVRGERKDASTEEAEGRTVREFRYGQFERTFQVPSHVTAEDVTADYDAGILTIRVAGAYRGAEPTRITIGHGAARDAESSDS